MVWVNIEGQKAAIGEHLSAPGPIELSGLDLAIDRQTFNCRLNRRRAGGTKKIRNSDGGKRSKNQLRQHETASAGAGEGGHASRREGFGKSRGIQIQINNSK